MGGSLSKKFVSKNEYAEIYIQLDQPFFYAGQNVTGKVYLYVHNAFPAGNLSFTIKGKEKVSWITEKFETHTTTDSNGVQHTESRTIKIPHRGHNLIINATAPLFSFPTVLAPGQYSFPFSMLLPPHFPGTFEIKSVDEAFSKIKEASIKYHIFARLLTLNNSITNLGYKMPLKIRPLLGSEITNITHQNQEGSVTKCCSDKGRCMLEVEFGKAVYALGETILMNAKADNTNSVAKMVSIRANLVQNIELVANREGNDNLNVNNSVSRNEQFIQLQSGQNMTQSVPLSFTIANQFMRDGRGADMIQPTVKGAILRCTYHICVYINFEGCCVMGPEIKFPICLYAPEFQLPQPIQPPPSWNPIIFQTGTISFASQGISISGVNPMMMPSISANIEQPVMNAQVNENMNMGIKMDINLNANANMMQNNAGFQMNVNLPNMEIKAENMNP